MNKILFETPMMINLTRKITCCNGNEAERNSGQVQRLIRNSLVYLDFAVAF